MIDLFRILGLIFIKRPEFYGLYHISYSDNGFRDYKFNSLLFNYCLLSLYGIWGITKQKTYATGWITYSGCRNHCIRIKKFRHNCSNKTWDKKVSFTTKLNFHIDVPFLSSIKNKITNISLILKKVEIKKLVALLW